MHYLHNHQGKDSWRKTRPTEIMPQATAIRPMAYVWCWNNKTAWNSDEFCSHHYRKLSWNYHYYWLNWSMLSERISANGWLWDSVPTLQYNFWQYQPKKGQLFFAGAVIALHRMYRASAEERERKKGGWKCVCVCVYLYTNMHTHNLADSLGLKNKGKIDLPLE